MSDAVKSELLFFVISVFAGVIGAVIFDFFRSLRKNRADKKKTVAAEDILFWVSEAVWVFAVIYKYNSGQIRFYFFVGFAVGAIIYLLTLSKIVINLFYTLKKIIEKTVKIAAKFIRIILKPVIFVASKIGGGFQMLHVRIKKIKKLLKMY